MSVQRGDSGPEVQQLQQALEAMGYFVGAIDGQFGEKTDAAVRYLQSCHGLAIDGVAGDQTYVVLGVQLGTVSSVDVRLPDLDVLSGTDEYVVSLTAEDDMWPEVRVVGWFRGAGGEEYTEETVSLSAGSTTLARLHVPAGINAVEGEVHVTVYVFDMQGTQLEEQFSSFRVDRADAI